MFTIEKFEREFEIPNGLSTRGLAACKAIRAFARKHEVQTGGGRTFHTPSGWDGEYGRQSELVVLYEGSGLAKWFSLDQCQYAAVIEMIELLSNFGVHPEECTTYYAAIYN